MYVYKHYFLLIVFLGVLNVCVAQETVKSSKDNFEWRLIGRALFDGGVFYDDKTELGNGVVINDVRLGGIMHFKENWNARIEVGYTNSRVSLKDIFIGYDRGEHHVKIGHFFEYFGIEGRVGTTDYRLMNAATTSTLFGDRRKLGINYIYNSTYFTGGLGFHTDSDIDNNKNTNQGYTIATKLTGRPIYTDESLVHIGFSSRYASFDREEKEDYTMTVGIPTAIINSSSNQFLGGTLDDVINEWRLGVDFITFYKWFYFQGEYIDAHVNRRNDGNYNQNYHPRGGYFQTGFLLLGDKQYRYNSQQGWISNPNPKNLEVLFRFNITSMNNIDEKNHKYFDGGLMRDYTLG
ncbi:MAG: hypothetical protein LIO65_00130, partial [Odoribacter sp.]|nr:hypothetical protein [Odoribacter sp.]